MVSQQNEKSIQSSLFVLVFQVDVDGSNGQYFVSLNFISFNVVLNQNDQIHPCPEAIRKTVV